MQKVFIPNIIGHKTMKLYSSISRNKLSLIIAAGIICALIMFYPAWGTAAEKPQRQLFVTVIQDQPVLSSSAAIDKLIDTAQKTGVGVLFIQVYRANQSWFASQNADQSPYEAGPKNLSHDPFALLIRRAHSAGIQVHAWLNILSLSNNQEALLLKKYGPEILTRNTQEKQKLEDYKIDNQYFLEPGDPRVRQEILAMVEDLLQGYPQLDGVQFDYIRYPDKNPFYGYTKINLQRFKDSTGCEKFQEKNPLWQDWKRRQVTELLELLVKKTRQIRPDIQVSATACAPFVRAYYEAFQDWPSWLNSGLVDFVTLMSYSAQNSEFDKDILEAKAKTNDLKKLSIAVGAYKFLRSPENFKKQFNACEKEKCRACVIFHYGSLLENPELGARLSTPSIPHTPQKARRDSL
ncbi:MAG: family 10 glycosylhydrolase [Candidatus Omnitrophica bacterium]|nr:family 10 glycosylhydrolase [Candidatus Omnitrophota bacterium]